jgi:nitric oxide reductase subunit B
MFRSQQLALRYFAAAMTLFGIMIVAGLLASTHYVQDGFMLNKLDFSITKTLHIDTMIIWLLMGFIGAVYWFLPIELEREVEGIKLAEIMFASTSRRRAGPRSASRWWCWCSSTT